MANTASMQITIKNWLYLANSYTTCTNIRYNYKRFIDLPKMYQRMGIDFVNTAVNPTFVHKAIFIVFNAT